MTGIFTKPSLPLLARKRAEECALSRSERVKMIQHAAEQIYAQLQLCSQEERVNLIVGIASQLHELLPPVLRAKLPRPD